MSTVLGNVTFCFLTELLGIGATTIATALWPVYRLVCVIWRPQV